MNKSLVVRILTIASLAIANTLVAQGQTTATSVQPKPISNYIREIGLTWMEKASDLQDLCLSSKKTTEDCYDAVEQTNKELEMIQRRVDLKLRESQQPEGDGVMFKLLQDVKTSLSIDMKNLANGLALNDMGVRKDDPQRLKIIAIGKRYGDAFTVCKIHAEQNIKSGHTESATLYGIDRPDVFLVNVDDANCMNGKTRATGTV
jgi:hypothetical protein